jgi:hypothetical protein
MIEDLLNTIRGHLIDERTINETAAELYYQDNPDFVAYWEQLSKAARKPYIDEVYRVMNALIRWFYSQE